MSESGGVSWRVVTVTGRERSRSPRSDAGSSPQKWPLWLAIVTLLLVALGAAAAFNLHLAAQLIGRPDETRYGEAILYDHAARLLRGEPLYQALDGPPYTIAAYTPLYYWLVAALRVAFGPGFLIGRLISLGAGVLIAGMIGWLVWRRARAPVAALLGGLLFIAFGLGGLVPWSAAYKEDLLGVALAMGSVVALDVAPSRRGVALAAALAAGAALTKQSLLGATLIGTLWLLVARRTRLAALFACTAALLGLGTAAILEATSHAFVENTVGGNLHQPLDALTLSYNLRELAIYQSMPALLALVGLAAAGRGRAADVSVAASRSTSRASSLLKDLLVLSWLGSLLPLVAIGAIGADSNYWLHFAALTSVLATLALWRWRTRWWGALAALFLIANAALAVYGVAAWHAARPAFLVGGSAVQAPLAQLVQRVRLTEGTVLADPLDVLVLAERPILLEPIVYSLRERDGAWDSSALLERVCAGEVSLVVLGYPPEELGQRFPSTVAAAIQRAFEVSDTLRVGGGQRWLLRQRGVGQACQ